VMASSLAAILGHKDKMQNLARVEQKPRSSLDHQNPSLPTAQLAHEKGRNCYCVDFGLSHKCNCVITTAQALTDYRGKSDMEQVRVLPLTHSSGWASLIPKSQTLQDLKPLEYQREVTRKFTHLTSCDGLQSKHRPTKTLL
jgi:hypothetical protein